MNAMPTTYQINQLVKPLFVPPEAKHTCKVMGLTCVLKNNRVDYAILHEDGILYILIPKRFDGEKYVPWRAKLRPRTLYSNLKYSTNTILGIQQAFITDFSS